MEMYSEIMEQQFTGENQVIKIRCEDDKDLSATKEMAIEVHALAGRLFRFGCRYFFWVISKTETTLSAFHPLFSFVLY